MAAWLPPAALAAEVATPALPSSYGWEQGQYLVYVFLLRAAVVSWGSSRLENKIADALPRCESLGIYTGDLYVTEETYSGNPKIAELTPWWKNPTPGERAHTPSVMWGILRERLKEHDMRAACDAADVDVSDLSPTGGVAGPEKHGAATKRWVEMKRRLESAGVEPPRLQY